MLCCFVDHYLGAWLHVRLLKKQNFIPWIHILRLRLSFWYCAHWSFLFDLDFFFFFISFGRYFFRKLLFWRRKFAFLSIFFLGLFFLQKFVDMINILLYNFLIVFIHFLVFLLFLLHLFLSWFFISSRRKTRTILIQRTPVEHKIIFLVSLLKSLQKKIFDL